jgi:outer membrane lipoprotein-sorting protein
MVKKIVCFFFLFVTGFIAFAQDAGAIIRSSRDRVDALTTSIRARMIITAKDGSTTERQLDQYSKKGPNGNRAMIVFQQPAGVRGTRYLTIENAGKNNDQWIFLPSLGKVRRIAASEGSASFMGTDFSYDDISSTTRNADLDTHTFLREDTYNNHACYVIETVPKDKSFQYSKMIEWIDKDTKINYKLELFDKRNTQVKLVEILEVKEVQGILTAVKTKMTTLAPGTFTFYNVDIVKYNDPIPESVFTTAYLETGRTR